MLPNMVRCLARIFTSILLPLLATSFTLVRVSGAEEIVISGRPLTKVESSDENTVRFNLTREQQSEYGLVILKRGNSYFWASREMKPLIHSVSGAFHYFSDPSGGGYIKVVDQRSLTEGGKPRFLYMKHLTLWMKTLTYWGTAEEFSP